MTRVSPATARPYRSHSRPACTSCRRRKSRCAVDAGDRVCLMCRVHDTVCSFEAQPGNSATRGAAKKLKKSRRSPVAHGESVAAEARKGTTEASRDPARDEAAAPSEHHVSGEDCRDGMPISLHQAEDDESPHILGPAVTSDSHVLADYLSNVRDGTRAMPMIRPMLGGDSEPVMFTKVQKRPLGMAVDPTPPSLQLQMIQKLVEPWAAELVRVFFATVNACFPVLDERSFMDQFLQSRDRISPALLAGIYAHSLTYWPYSPDLSGHRCPDGRFAWNLANQVLFSELRHSPGISTLPAMLLNVGGRPTTSMIGNGLLLGSAVSLSHSLGLNRNPLSWNIPQAEKYLRMKLWWCLLVQDRWCSVAHGTPPRLRNNQYDVPLPQVEYLLPEDHSEEHASAAAVFCALVELSELLQGFLDHVYSLEPAGPTRGLEVVLDQWVDSLQNHVRKIIIRGSMLNLPGAPNLRLAYLATRLLLRRIELNQAKKTLDPDPTDLGMRYMQVRRTAEDIVSLVQELELSQLGGFWLPVAAFTFSHTVTFLIRCAVETTNIPGGLSRNPSLQLANDLVTALRTHQERHGWDLADICVSQHSDMITRLLTEETSGDDLADAFMTLQDPLAMDYPFMDDMFYSNTELFNF